VANVAIELTGVGRTFEGKDGRRDVQALEDVSFRVFEGEFVSLVGPSGCGKSTVLNLVAGLTRASQGTILVRGLPLQGIHPDVGYVFQRDTLLPWRTVLDNVVLGPELRGIDRDTRARQALELIRKVGLGAFEHHYPHELSGGMRKRCELIRTLINRPSILLMDEPFGALDAQTRYVLQEELLRMWQAERNNDRLRDPRHRRGHRAVGPRPRHVAPARPHPQEPGDPPARLAERARRAILPGLQRSLRGDLGHPARRAHRALTPWRPTH